jgi:hypothetical protein
VAPRTRVARDRRATCGVPPGYLGCEALLEDADPLETITDPTSARLRRCATRPARRDSPKGVLYSNRARAARAAVALPSGLGVAEPDAALPSSRCFTPRLGVPYAAVMVGAKIE